MRFWSVYFFSLFSSCFFPTVFNFCSSCGILTQIIRYTKSFTLKLYIITDNMSRKPKKPISCPFYITSSGNRHHSPSTFFGFFTTEHSSKCDTFQLTTKFYNPCFSRNPTITYFSNPQVFLARVLNRFYKHNCIFVP